MYNKHHNLDLSYFCRIVDHFGNEFLPQTCCLQDYPACARLSKLMAVKIADPLISNFSR